MKTFKNRRWRLMASGPIQGGLMVRLVLYWCLFQFSVFATVALFSFLTDGEFKGASLLWTAFIASFMVLPVVMLDMLKFSNRFSGPIVNISKKLEQMAENKKVEKINLRPDDLCKGLAGNLNKVVARLNRIHGTKNTPPVSGQDQSEIECHV